RVGDEVERGAVGKADADRGIGAGLDHVALVDGVADVERDRDAVAHDGDVADDLLHLADGVGRSGRLRLRVFAGRRRAGQEIDQIGRQTGAVRRDQGRVLFARKIAGNDVVAAVMAGEDEVGTRSLEIPGKQQLQIGNADRVEV